MDRRHDTLRLVPSLPSVSALHVYPVKSTIGEQADFLDLDERGVVGDRLWSIRTEDGKIGSGKNSKRFAAVPGLLMLRASMRADRVTLSLPDGQTVAVDDPAAPAVLSRFLRRPVTLAAETDTMHFDDGPVSLLGAGSLSALADEVGEDIDASRFRPNVVMSGVAAFAEDRWVGRRVRIGAAVLEVTMRSPRCVMVDMATADLPVQRGNLRATGRVNEACLGVIARVVTAGRMSVGDAVVLAD